MDILFLYNLDNKEFTEISIEIEESIKNLISDKEINVIRKDKVSLKLKPDVYVILTDESNEAEEYFEKIKERDKSIVLTNNLSSSNILNLVDNTKNVCYMKNDTELLVKKIYNVYIDANEKHA